MTFGQSIQTVFRKYAEFTGRASRPEYWWFALFSFLVSSALNTPVYGVSFTNGLHLGTTTTGLAGLWSLAVLLPSLAVAVRRLRDAGRGWGELFWILLPLVGWIILIVHLCDPSKPAGPAAPPTAQPQSAGAPPLAG